MGLRLTPRSSLLNLLEKLDTDWSGEAVKNIEKTLSWSYTYGVFRMLHRDWGTGKEVCEKNEG